jgi:hypothetical protein
MIEELKRKIKVLNEQVWEHRAPWPAIEEWLRNFDGATAATDSERLHALYMLAQFMYFGSKEIRALLRAMFRDEYRYPIVEKIRKENGDTLDQNVINNHFLTELSATRFLGMGNPSESGTHLLYYFRQENGLPKDLFINPHQIFDYDSAGVRQIRDRAVKRYVFLDDFCGSGRQAKDYSRDIVEPIRRLQPLASVSYYVLFATTTSVDEIQANTAFTEVNSIFDLDPSFKCFGDKSRYFAATLPGIVKKTAHDMSMHYGRQLWSSHPLGYGDCQLLIGFHHNTPDNTLPIIWFDEGTTSWLPIFKRYPKLTWA